MKMAVLYALAAAFLTEIVQLFFGRNGCLRDVLIDSLGIAAFCALQRKKHTAKHTKTGSL